MTKTELIMLIADRVKVSQKVAQDVIDAFQDIVTETLADEGEKVLLSGFGTFEVRERASRSGKNPRTGEVISIAATKIPGFKAGKLFKEAVNK